MAAREQDMDRISLRLVNDVLKADKYAANSKATSTLLYRPSFSLCVSGMWTAPPRLLIAARKADQYDAAEIPHNSRLFGFLCYDLGKAPTISVLVVLMLSLRVRMPLLLPLLLLPLLHKTCSMGHSSATPVADPLLCASGGNTPTHIVLTQTPACMAPSTHCCRAQNKSQS